MFRRLVAFLVFLFFAQSGWALAPEEVVRAAIIEDLLDGDASLLQEDAAPAEFIKRIAHRVGKNLPASATGISGVDFHFNRRGEAEGTPLHVSVWVFTYANAKKARAKDARIFTGGNFRSKVLTVFSHFVDENRVVIVFSESYDDRTVREFVQSFASRIKEEKAAGAGNAISPHRLHPGS
ncbi:MAG: hypothetical protein LBU11_11070 [Zoogloeaceae bacterium]|jgi:hypothetical protein|nr:hypothetical protein [Zoogloeaceae bacterium]